jgi:hypothetical protein
MINTGAPSYFAQFGTFYGPTYAAQSFQLLSSAPEPATWAMMLIGVGALGASMRTRRRTSAALA